MRLTSDHYKYELKRYHEQLEHLEKQKENWAEDKYNRVKTFYHEKITEFRSIIHKAHPEWLIQFDADRANEITVIEGNEITAEGCKVLG